MNINGKPHRSIWLNTENETIVQIIDQRQLPHQFIIENLQSVNQMAIAIQEMHVRGAGLIGAAAAFGIYLATLEAPKDNSFDPYVAEAAKKLKATRPTAINLSWAVDKQLNALQNALPYPLQYFVR